MTGHEVVAVVVVERDPVRDLDAHEVGERTRRFEPEHSGDELRGRHAVLARHDEVVQLHGHSSPSTGSRLAAYPRPLVGSPEPGAWLHE